MKGDSTDFSAVAKARSPWRLAGAASLLLGLLPLAVSACGSGDGGSDASAARGGETIREFGSKASPAQRARATAVLDGYLTARAQGRWAKACGYLAESAQRLASRLAARSPRVDGEGCEAWLKAWLNDPVEADVSSVHIAGDRGYIFYDDGEGRDHAIAIEREDGSWGLVGLNGTVLGRR